MGVCGACFLRDTAGALGLGTGPAIFRPEVAGLALGALGLVLVTGRWQARSGSHAVARFLLGALMGVAALVFLGCPFRLLQRLGGGDLAAWLALPGFVAGVGVAVLLEKRGYSVGKTSPVPAPVGILGPLVFAGLLAAFLVGGYLKGPGPGAGGTPLHAPWEWSLSIALAVGVVLSLTGFCAVSAARRVFLPGRGMLFAALALVTGYAAYRLATGTFAFTWSAPMAHGDHAWSAGALFLLGLAGALAGGCPVRQIVMAGEGNGDAFVTVAGIAVGAALAHGGGLVSSPAGTTSAGRAAVVGGTVLALLYGVSMSRRRDAPMPAAAPAPLEGATKR
jgi:YedE family putative selenium metabolism protein